jgi:serine protein kinase
MAEGKDILSFIGGQQDRKVYQALNWAGSFSDYLNIISQNPRVLRTAYQRLYDMILSYGTEEYVDSKKKIIKYNFFKDTAFEGKDAIYGLDIPLMRLVNVFKSAAKFYGTERRVLLLHGPVGSSKSTIVRLLKRGLERYSRTDEGALFTFGWNVDWKTGKTSEEHVPCPMNEEPFKLIPPELRAQVLEKLGVQQKDLDHPIPDFGDLCPSCRFTFSELLKRYEGDWQKVIQHVRVHRLILSEKDRIGIGTFQPKDEKNQDSTELTGDINYRKIAEYGSDSDPRAFNFDGEFNIANRGIIEFIEILKLDVAFLYDLLGATQEHLIKPKKFAQTDIDEVIIGHTNEAEFRKLLNNEFMEALRDRTIKVDVPYITKPSLEVKVYQKDYAPEKIRGKHIAPHTLPADGLGLGGAHPPGGAQEAQPHPVAEDEALRRQVPDRLHRGQHQGAEKRGRSRGDGRHQPALHPGQDIQLPGLGQRRGLHQPLPGPQRAGGGTEEPHADHQRG